MQQNKDGIDEKRERFRFRLSRVIGMVGPGFSSECSRTFFSFLSIIELRGG